jgi:hypothetical protein
VTATFFPHDAPFADFCAVSLSREDRTDAVIAAMSVCGLREVWRRTVQDHLSLVFAPKHIPAGVAFFEGYCFRDHVLLPSASGTADGASLHGHGHYTAVEPLEDRVVCRADPLGLSQLYYFAGRPALVTNRVELARRVLEAATGRPARLNHHAAARTFQYATPFWNETLIEGVFLSPLRHDVVLSADRVDLEGEPPSAPASYASLLETAANDIASNVLAIVETFGERSPVVSLSGGVDCRVLMAAIVGAGVQDRFRYYTYGAKDSADRRIAGSLRERYGLSEARRRLPPQLPPDVIFDRGSGFNWGLRTIAGDGYYDAEPRDEVLLNGGCGETFRGYFSHHIHAKMGDALYSASEDEVVEGFFRAHGTKFHIVPEAWQRIRGRIASEIRAGGSDPVTNVDLLYPNFRNRFHFGLGGRVRSSSSLTLSPVNSVAAFEASMHLPGEERSRNRVAYDLIRTLAPELAAVPTTDGQWAASFAAGQTYEDLLPSTDLPWDRSPHRRPDITEAAGRSAVQSITRIAESEQDFHGVASVVNIARLKRVFEEIVAGERELNRSRLIQYAQFFKAAAQLDATR